MVVDGENDDDDDDSKGKRDTPILRSVANLLVSW